MTVHKKEKNFKCEECGKSFGEKAQLKKHERLHLFTYCAKCKDHFEDIKQHNEEKHSNLKHSCVSCYKVFERLRDLESHIKTKHSTIRSYFCDNCNKGFAEKFQIERHMKVHKKQFEREAKIKKEVEFSTNEMEDRISPKLEIKEESHIYIKQEQVINQHTTPEFKIKLELQDDDTNYDYEPLNPFSSEEVDFKKESSVSLDYVQNDSDDQSDDSIVSYKDNRSNNRNKKSKKESRVKNGPKKNLRKEQGSKFICDICGSQFSHKFTARKHMDSIHKKIKHECETCHKTFTFKNTLYTHIKVVHQQKRSHECQFCKKKFGVKYSLTKHIETVHSENPSGRKKYECILCDKTFSTNSGLYIHKKVVHEKVKKYKKAELQCKICYEPTKTKDHDLLHSIQVHLNGKKLKRVCGYCKKEFDLYEDFKTHIESHVGLFICMICDKFYMDEQCLKSHKDSHKKVDIKYRNYVCDHCGERLLTKLLMKVHDKFFYLIGSK